MSQESAIVILAVILVSILLFLLFTDIGHELLAYLMGSVVGLLVYVVGFVLLIVVCAGLFYLGYLVLLAFGG